MVKIISLVIGSAVSILVGGTVCAAATAERTVPAQFWETLKDNIRNSCTESRAQTYTLSELGPEALSLTCECTAAETVKRLSASSDMNQALLANDKPRMRQILAKSVTNVDGKPVVTWCAEQAMAPKGSAAAHLLLKDKGPVSTKKGLAGQSRANFIRASAGACKAEVKKLIDGTGAGDEEIAKACQCIGDAMADALSEQELVDIVKSKTLRSELKQTRNRAMSGCVQQALQ